jgi:hypothetical protein
MPEVSLDAPKILAVYLQIAQYPILAKQIRRRMREELYRRGVLSRERLEAEARDKAVLSQQREGLVDPLQEEDARLWEQRLQQVRDYLTDFYFAYNLPLDLFNNIIENLLSERSMRRHEGSSLFFNPELAPVELLLRQLAQYEALPEEEREKSRYHMEEMVVVLIKTMISDQLGFVRVAKSWLDTPDFEFIQARRIGHGKIGGKAGGMLLAWRILQKCIPDDIDHITIPKSFFIGADVFFDFLSLNSLEYLNQKYKPLDQIREEYGHIQEEYIRSRFPDEITNGLRAVLTEVGHTPIIVRSSSLLEDSLGTAFAGKYSSYFCPNQGSPKENLRDLTLAIRRIYASVHSPDALFYRRRMGLLDYDERMAILLQEVQGQAYRDYYFPTLAGVAYSYSPIVWSSQLRREEGFARLVVGMGTRAVDRVPDDYPRLVTLSHPTVRPEIATQAVCKYSQKKIDLIDMRNNAFVTLPITNALGPDFSPLPWLASVAQGDTLRLWEAQGENVASHRFVFTMDALLEEGSFPVLLKKILHILQTKYGVPVDVEFTASLSRDAHGLNVAVQLLQCRSQTALRSALPQTMPENIQSENVLFIATRMVPQGAVHQVDFIGFVDPIQYSRLPEVSDRRKVAHTIGQLNKALEGRTFILVGPGRWGSYNSALGVPITYADIYNTRAIVELAVEQEGITPEPSYGTHFFQDLVEAQIYPLALYPDQSGDLFQRDLIDQADDCLADVLMDPADQHSCVKLVNIPRAFGGSRMNILMDGAQAICFLVDAEGNSHPQA